MTYVSTGVSQSAHQVTQQHSVVVVVIAQQLFSYRQLSRLRKSATAAGTATLGHCSHRLFRFSMCRADALTSANNPSAVQRLQLGTLCLLLSSTVTLSLCLNLG